MRQMYFTPVGKLYADNSLLLIIVKEVKNSRPEDFHVGTMVQVEIKVTWAGFV